MLFTAPSVAPERQRSVNPAVTASRSLVSLRATPLRPGRGLVDPGGQEDAGLLGKHVTEVADELVRGGQLGAGVQNRFELPVFILRERAWPTGEPAGGQPCGRQCRGLVWSPAGLVKAAPRPVAQCGVASCQTRSASSLCRAVSDMPPRVSAMRRESRDGGRRGGCLAGGVPGTPGASARRGRTAAQWPTRCRPPSAPSRRNCPDLDPPQGRVRTATGGRQGGGPAARPERGPDRPTA